jgi:cell division cycle 2-like protein
MQFSSASPGTLDLLTRLLTLNPNDRITAQQALEHDYFVREFPPMKDPELFMSFPSKGGMEHRRKVTS